MRFAYCVVVALEKKLKAAQELSENFEVIVGISYFKFFSCLHNYLALCS